MGTGQHDDDNTLIFTKKKTNNTQVYLLKSHIAIQANRFSSWKETTKTNFSLPPAHHHATRHHQFPSAVHQYCAATKTAYFYCTKIFITANTQFIASTKKNNPSTQLIVFPSLPPFK
jgi:hypothetical protein